MAHFGGIDRIIMGTDSDAFVIFEDLKDACGAVLKDHLIVDKFRVKLAWFQPYMRQTRVSRPGGKGALKFTNKGKN